MAQATTAKQQKILDALENGGEIDPSIKAKVEAKEIKGPKRYMGIPGLTLVGIGKFPFETEDKELQKRIEGSRSFKSGHIWIDTKTKKEAAQAEKLLRGLSSQQLVRFAYALGHRDVGRLSKYELIELCTREGASLL